MSSRANPEVPRPRPPNALISWGDHDSVDDSGDDLAHGTGIGARRNTQIASPGGRARTSRRHLQPQREHADDRIGTVLGSYRILELLGKGGMGFVYRAEHVKLGREVALKVLRRSHALRREAVARFFQEARTVNRIRHANIVDATDFVELDDGTAFIIMELLRGQSLRAWARGAELPAALAVLIQICDGLAAAHAVGVIHRDLKPDNVMILERPDGRAQVKLLDFGVAKLIYRDDDDVGVETAAGSVIGTPAYMSPEQAGGGAIDARADIYAVGAIMYELFTGRPMFRAKSCAEYVRKQLSEVPRRPRSTAGGAGMDRRLEAVILGAIEKDPNRRFPSITALRDRLIDLLDAIEFAAAQTTTDGAPAASSIRLVAPRPTRATPWCVGFTISALVLGLAIGVAVCIATRGDAPVGTARASATTVAALPVLPPPQRVQITFASLPPAGVYAVGATTALCHTPCTLDVDRCDGGAPDHRDYVLRADGYVDTTVRVALTDSARIDVPPVVLPRVHQPHRP